MCEEIVGIGSSIIIVFDNIHHVAVITYGDTGLARIHQYNVGMYSVYSPYVLMEKNLHDIFVLPSRGSGVLMETKGY